MASRVPTHTCSGLLDDANTRRTPAGQSNFNEKQPYMTIIDQKFGSSVVFLGNFRHDNIMASNRATEILEDLRRHRIALGVSTRLLAKTAGVSRATIINAEKGVRIRSGTAARIQGAILLLSRMDPNGRRISTEVKTNMSECDRDVESFSDPSYSEAVIRIVEDIPNSLKKHFYSKERLIDLNMALDVALKSVQASVSNRTGE